MVLFVISPFFSSVFDHVVLTSTVVYVIVADTGCTWGLKCLSYNRDSPGRPATYEERHGYVYDNDACGQGVAMYILGMLSSFLYLRLSCCDTSIHCGTC